MKTKSRTTMKMSDFNQIPQSIKRKPTFTLFSNALKQWLFSKFDLNYVVGIVV